jgi:hypothetical protein
LRANIRDRRLSWKAAQRKKRASKDGLKKAVAAGSANGKVVPVVTL